MHDIPSFFAIRFSHKQDIKKLLDYYNHQKLTSHFFIDGLTHHKKEVSIGDLVFLVASGWKNNISITYEQGLYGVAKVVSNPVSTTPKAYSINVQFIYFFEKVLTKKDFLTFPNTADIPYIGPSIKGTKTQAISIITKEKAKEVILSAQKITKTDINIFNAHFPWFFNDTFSISDKIFNKMTDDHAPALEVTTVAVVFSKFIVNYSHEDTATMIGIFGQWGRGKTFFFKEVKKSLINNNDKNKHYNFAVFQPWRYQEKESAWAYLYQTILQVFLDNKTGWWCGTCSFFKRIWLKLYDLGIFKIIFILILAVAGYQLLDYFQSLMETTKKPFGDFIKHFGGAGIILYVLYILLKDHQEVAASLINNYTKNKNVSNKLGFQNEILIRFKRLIHTFFLNSNTEDKLILFVDDLDRCNEELIIDILDSLRLMLDDETIRKRIIVLTAIDERILLKSIEHKFSFQPDEHIVIQPEEYIEKFFLMGIKLDPLSTKDIKELVNAYSQKINIINSNDFQKSSTEKVQITPSSTPLTMQTNKVSVITNNDNLPEATKQTNKKFNYIMEEEEKKYLAERMIQLENATPRKINMYIHRYLFFKGLASALFNKSFLTSVNPRLYIDFIFFISKYPDIYNEKLLEINNDYRADKLIELQPCDYKYEIRSEDALKLFRITSMVCPF